MSYKAPSLKVKEMRSPEDNDICVVCYREAEIFSIGECDHPVCYDCSTRMRVLCARTECPICRKDMAMVIFIGKKIPFSTIQYRNMQCERRYSIYFEKDYIMKLYDKLLEHSCDICSANPTFRTFANLKEHMKKVHEQFYCDLCVDNLMIFTKERRYYNRSLLAQHRRKGDTDDTSHRGHPLCEFCDSRFMDNDELFRHLRRDHFFCHFCDADGIHQYYDDYSALRKHFRDDHFLCEEGDCIEERFTSVYRTKLDIQAHIAQNHGQNMSKSQARQARTVDIAFTVNHRENQPNRRRGRGRGDIHCQDTDEQMVAASAAPPSQMLTKQQAVDINCVQDFPSLKGRAESKCDGSVSKSMAQKVAHQNRFTIRTARGHALNSEEFPYLSSSTSVTVTSAPSVSNPSESIVPSTSVHLSVNTKNSTNQFDMSNVSTGPNVSIQYNCNNPPLPSQESNSALFSKTNNCNSKPCIAGISHSSNITVKNNTSMRARMKPNVLGEDFPSLQPATKSLQLQEPSATWVSGQSNIAKVTNREVPKSEIQPPKPKSKPFEANDFPSLMPSSESQLHMLNYSGRSSLTIPMKKAHNNNNSNNNIKTNENDENLASKGKKKKKPFAGSIGKEVNKAPQNGIKSKKKIPTLNNIFDDSDSDVPREDFSKGRLGEYESVAPARSSNVHFITPNSNSDMKKSELQIGSLQVAPEISSPGDFPSLFKASNKSKGNNKNSDFNGNATNNVYKQSPCHVNKKKVSAPPPGFNKPQTGIPPGFSNTDMTFTSSQGHKFVVASTQDSQPLNSNAINKGKKSNFNFNGGFIFPPNFEERNNMLISTISDLCNGNYEKFNKFKYLAEIFRSGDIQGQEYYERCRHVMGKKGFHKILPELLVLLPDISKQQAVLQAYRRVDNGQGCLTCFAICAVCQQVLIPDDFKLHMNSHEMMQEEFPSLKSGGILLNRN